MASSFTLDGKHFDEAEKFISSFKGKEGVVRVTIGKTGVELRITEDGIFGSCKLPIVATGSDDVYMKYSVMSSILSASRNSSVKFEIRDENLVQVTEDGVVLNISPEFYNGIAFQVPVLDDPVEQVIIGYEKMLTIVKKVSVNGSSDAPVTPVMKVGAQWRYGSQVNVTLYNNEEFEDVDWTVPSTMMRCIQNVTKLQDNISFLHVHGEYENYIVVHSSYSTYWTTMAGIEPIDISDFIAQDIQSSTSWNKSSDISCSLEKLYIPLIGSVDEPHIIVTIGEGKTKLLVTDLANRISFDVVDQEGQEAYNEAVELSFHAFASVMKKMDSNLPFSVSVKESCLIFQQGDGTAGTLTCLITRFI